MKLEKLVNKMKKSASKRINKVHTKIHKHLSKHGIHLSISDYEVYKDVYLLFKRVGLHATWYDRPDCIISAVVGLRDLSLTVLNLSLSLTLIKY